MALVNITEAAKLAGISRTYLYKKYINTNKISVSVDAKGNKQIETSELLRVFGELHGDVNNDANSLHKMTTPEHTDYDVISARLAAAENVIELKNEIIKEKDLRIDDLKTSLLLLTNNKQPETSETKPSRSRTIYFALILLAVALFAIFYFSPMPLHVRA